MTENTIIVIALFFIYYNIGGLATTNILRLTYGNDLSILSSKCLCDNCGAKIPPHLQLPIISFIICKGKCQKCHTKIPIHPLILEITILLGMSFFSALFEFSYVGIFASFFFYEIMRIIIIFIKKKRTNEFVKQYIISVITMLPFLALCLFVSALYSVV